MSSWFVKFLSSLEIDKPRVFVETGSYFGEGINNVKNDFELIYSIEISQKLYSHCKELFSNQQNICLLPGDSAEVLSELSQEINEPALFFLDARGESFREEDNGCPLLRELEVLGKRIHNDIIIINDMRLMGKVSENFDFTHINQQKILDSYNRNCKIYLPGNIDRMIIVPY